EVRREVAEDRLLAVAERLEQRRDRPPRRETVLERGDELADDRAMRRPRADLRAQQGLHPPSGFDEGPPVTAALAVLQRLLDRARRGGGVAGLVVGDRERRERLDGGAAVDRRRRPGEHLD